MVEGLVSLDDFLVAGMHFVQAGGGVDFAEDVEFDFGVTDELFHGFDDFHGLPVVGFAVVDANNAAEGAILNLGDEHVALIENFLLD